MTYSTTSRSFSVHSEQFDSCARDSGSLGMYCYPHENGVTEIDEETLSPSVSEEE